MARGDLIELEITDIVYGGNAFGRHDNKAVFVPYALPGERIEARIVEERKRFAVAEVVRVLTASPQRVTPPCPYFGPGKCGGCQWQHMEYAAQLAYKEKIVRDQLTRFGGIADALVHPTLPSPEPWAYRSHATMQTVGDGRLGYVATDRKTLIPIETCLIVRPELDALLGDLPTDELEGVRRVRLQVGQPSEDVLLIATEADDPQEDETSPPAPDVRPDADETPLSTEVNVRYTVHYREFQVTGGSFFQVNVPQAAALVEGILRRLDLKGDERVLDLYAGVGLFTAFLAAEVRQVTAIESSPTATRDAQVNLSAFGNVLYISDTVEEALPKVSGTFDAAVVDPPRSGLGAKVVALLVAIAPKTLVYVSCDPASLARDAKALIAGGYRFVDAQPVDMFPQTHHVETIAMFVWEGNE